MIKRIALMAALIAAPSAASTVVWNPLEEEYQRQKPAGIFYLPKGCRYVTADHPGPDRILWLTDCGLFSLADYTKGESLEKFDGIFATDLISQPDIGAARSTPGATSPRSDSRNSSGAGFLSGGNVVVSSEPNPQTPIVAAEVPAPASYLLSVIALLMLWHFGGRKPKPGIALS